MAIPQWCSMGKLNAPLILAIVDRGATCPSAVSAGSIDPLPTLHLMSEPRIKSFGRCNRLGDSGISPNTND